ncbi:MAG: ABC transporter permease [Blastocatellia bacterium]
MSGWVDFFLADLRYAWRAMRRGKSFTAAIILIFALGLGATSAIFSITYAVLFKPLVFPDADRLVMVWESNQQLGRDRNLVAPANLFEWQSQSNLFERVAAISNVEYTLTETGAAESLLGQRVSADFFPLLGAEALLGRTFSSEEDRAGQNVIVLSHRLWQQRFGGDSGVLGKLIALGGSSYTVVGVMRPGFEFIDNLPNFWVPLGLNPGRGWEEGRYLRVVAKLKDGVNLFQAQTALGELAHQLEDKNPAMNRGWGVRLVPLYEEYVGSVRQALLVLLGAAAFVLVISCANIANLLLARGVGRRREFGIRAALGASRGLLVRQLLTESLMLSMIGATAGLMIVGLAIYFVPGLIPKDLPVPRLNQMGIAFPVLGFSILTAIATSLVSGILPAIAISKVDLNTILREATRGSSSGRGSKYARNWLVVLEIALALMLLVGAGLMIKSFHRLQTTYLGFVPDHVVTMKVSLPASRYREDEKKNAFFNELLGRVSELPGVNAAAGVDYLPLTGEGVGTFFEVENRPGFSNGEKPITLMRAVTPKYFEVLRIPLIEGRGFNEFDTADRPRVYVINENMAKRYFPGESPVGKRLVITWNKPLAGEIVGVVADVKYPNLTAAPGPTVYWPYSQTSSGSMNIAVHTSTPPDRLAAAVTSELRTLDKDLPLKNVATMDQIRSDASSRARFTTTLLVIFAALALLLAAIGIFSLLSYSVAQRTHEIGIRIALGAEPSDVLKMVLTQGMSMVLLGVSIGMVASFVLTRFMTSLLYGVTPTDPLTFVAVAVLLSAIALLAIVLPARKAARVDPLVALKYE